MRHFDTAALRNAGKIAFSRRPGDAYAYELKTNAPVSGTDRTGRTLSPWLMVDIPVAFTLGGIADVVERANATMTFYNFLNEKYRVFSNVSVNDVQKYTIAIASLHALMLDLKKRLKAYDYKDEESLFVGSKLRYALGVQNKNVALSALDLPNLAKTINKIIDNLNKLPIPSGFGIIDKLFYEVSTFFKEDTYTKSTLYWFTLANYYYWDVNSESATAGEVIPRIGLFAQDDIYSSTAAGLKRIYPTPASIIANSDTSMANIIKSRLDTIETILAQYLADETISEIARRINNAAQYGCALYKQEYITLGDSCAMPAVFDPQLSLEIKNAHLFNTIELSSIEENLSFGYLMQDVKVDNTVTPVLTDDVSILDSEQFFARITSLPFCTKVPYICKCNKDTVSDLDSSETLEQKMILKNQNMLRRIEFNTGAEGSGAKTQFVNHSSSILYGTFNIYFSTRDQDNNNEPWSFGLAVVPQVAIGVIPNHDACAYFKLLQEIDFMPIIWFVWYDTEGSNALTDIMYVHYGDCDNYTVVDETTLSTYFSYLMQAQFDYGY